ncbi:MAG TPA: tripartite tricarboxylate transporter substrate binding protein [Burkholderiales bacterium]|nr:tripartite tricarboxylate transporter substrate binding protein [Burkholderiales bacterium]
MTGALKKAFAALAAAAWCALAGSAGAQSYPAKPVKILVGFAAGGPTDVIARIVAGDMSASLGQSFVVENRPGANAIIATEAVARSAPDGYTLLFSSLSLLVNAILMEGKVHYDPFKDFAPVSNAAVLPMVVVTSPETRISSMQDLIVLARAKPGELSYATSGNGGSTHLAGAMLENATGTKMINVPFKGNGPALAEVMAGRVTFMFYPIVGIADQVSAKKLKVLAVGTQRPHADFPAVPTLEQSGLPGFEETAPWVGMLAPAGTPASAVNRLADEMRKSLARRETQERMKALGAVTVADTPSEFAAFLKKDHERWARVIRASGVKAE